MANKNVTITLMLLSSRLTRFWPHPEAVDSRGHRRFDDRQAVLLTSSAARNRQLGRRGMVTDIGYHIMYEQA
jgi:hypothetical protein